MTTLNKDVRTRDLIIFGISINPESYDIKDFDDLTLSNLKKLFDQNFIKPDGNHNDSPTAKQIFEFLKQNPNFTANGYVVSINRDDYRTTLTGVNHNTEALTNTGLINFSNLFQNADEFDAGKGYAWYD